MKDFSVMKPREVEAYLREQIRKLWGDKIENVSSVVSSHGYYTVTVNREKDFTIEFTFRKKRVPEIVDNLKMLAEKF